MTIATDGSFIDKMHESIDFAERNRKKVFARRLTMMERVRATLLQRRRAVIPSTFDVMVDDALNKDEVFNVAIANERWGGRLATMYALAELVAAQHETNALLRQMLKEMPKS